ncbi:MAG TPA: DEAD/DEAH box helicase family protein [Candidatus Chromulinivoraceae bacterium]|nr:DEAD/DEAH box helicase family protein [Candidatus Chromulinivoraceae bacterium]
MQPSDKIRLYRSLFRGRDDVFAKRSPTTGAYFPEHTLNWDEFNAHKANGGRMATFKNKKPTPLTDEIILKHLTGQITVGIYPILQDNTSYFLAADFDKENWLKDCQNYRVEIAKLGLSAYIERSRSGNGGHVWVFFEDAYPCHKARAIGLEVVRKILKLSAFDKEASFDRLFPNQDAIVKDGFGNLIALPFQGESARGGNTVFINPSTGIPYEDQFEILKTAQRYSIKELDAAYDKAIGATIDDVTAPIKNKRLKISVGQNITFNKAQLSGALVGYLKEELNFLNSEYLTKKRFGVSLYQVQKYFRLIDESDKTVSLPRGFLSRLLKFLYENNIEYSISFITPKFDNLKFKSQIKLNEQQEQIVSAAMIEKQGVIVAPPGSGKTMMGMELIARHKKPSLVLVHRKQILDQWVDRIQQYLNIPKAQIGRYSSAKKSAGKEITVGLLQSFARSKDLSELRDKFGTIIVDECHHIPAKTFRDVIASLNPEFLYGLTATPKRKHNDEQLIYVYIGDIIANMADFKDINQPATSKKFDVVIRETGLAIPFNWKTDAFDLVAKVISYDTKRNELVIKDALKQVALKRKVLVLSERKEHLKILELYLKGQCETMIFTGDDSAASRTSKLAQIEAGHYQVLLATGQIIGEGMHVPNIQALIFAFPFALEAKTTQYVGRLMHSDSPKVLIDYHDKQIPFLDRQFKQRKRVYNKL